MMLAPVLTPHGLLMLAQSLEAEGEAPALEPEHGLRLEKAFARGAGHGLVLLGADEVGTNSFSNAVLLAEIGGALHDCVVRPSRHRRAKQAAGADPRGRRVGHDGRGRSADDRRGVRDHGSPGQSMARHGFGLRYRAGSIQAHSAGVPQAPSSGLELSGACSFQPCGELERRGRPFRVSCNVHDPAFSRGQAAASAARQSLAGVLRREKPRAPAIAPDARPAGRRALPLVEGDGRCGRNLSPAALEPTTGGAIPAGRSRARKRRRARAHAGKLAHEPSSSPAGEGNGRRQCPLASRDGCAARLSDGGDARR